MDSGYFRYTSTGGSPGLGGPGSAKLRDGAIVNTVSLGGTGAFAGPGKVDTSLLAAMFGLSALPVTYPGGGTNYANGSAQTVSTTAGDDHLNGLYNNVPIVTQIANYLAAVGSVADANALFMIGSGPNDLIWLQTAPQTTTYPALSAQMAAYMQMQARTLAATVATLQTDGARTIIELNTYNWARLATAGGQFTTTNATDVQEARLYSVFIWSALASAGVNFVRADVEDLLKCVWQNPSQFCFTPATVLAGTPACVSQSALVCNPSQLRTPDAEQTFLFADAAHLTTAGQTIEADYMYSLLTAPSEISLLAETAVQGGMARAATVQGQIDLSREHHGPSGINVWVSAGASSLSVKNAPNFSNTSGTPFGIIVGAAFTGGGQTQNLSTGGHFTQTDAAPSLYAAYQAGPAWGNAVASYDFLQDHVARQVALGSFTDQNDGDTSGHDLALALRGNWNLHLGPVTTGPVAGIVLQQVRLDGFTETGTSGVTALSFGSQTRNSAVSQLGWRAAVAVGDWQPFAELDWNREWAGGNRTITATLTTVAAPSFATAAAPAASDWATASLGCSYRLTAQVILRAAAFAEFVNPEASSYGGELGVNVSF